jgi:F0F1-type ATP synthase assembly protein I
MSRQQPQNPLKKTSSFLRFTSLAMQMMLTMVVFTFSGFYLDKWLGLEFPIFTLILTLAGIAAALYSVLKNLMK